MFLTIMTRTFKRPKALARNKESLSAQTDQDFEQVIIVDEEGVGVERANLFFAENADLVKGDYVMMLDDDGQLFNPDAIALLKQAVGRYNPDVVIYKSEYPWGDLPEKCWMTSRCPVWGDIGGGSLIVRSDIWKKYIYTFRGLPGDYQFICNLFGVGCSIHWLDEVLTIAGIGHGAPEEE